MFPKLQGDMGQMVKPGYFNDAPILTPDDDRFGIDRFVLALAKSFKGIESPVGATIAINGQWGSGKSSAVNLIRYYLNEEVESERIAIVDFKCWWFRGEEALTLAFLQTLNAHLQKSLGGKAKELIPRLGRTLLQAGPVVGPAMNLATGGVWGALTSGSMDFGKRFFSEGESIEKIFERLSKALDDQTKRFLVIIDDIDRLTPAEALLVFRLVKSVGRLPNVMYLLVFDRELAEKAVNDVYPSEGPHFLEKIIQASFELPLPARDDLNIAALTQIETICGAQEDIDQLRRFMNVFYDAVAPYLITPRDLTRLANAMAVSWPPVAKEVDIGDFVALEVMRLFEPALYNMVRVNKERVCGTKSDYEQRDAPELELSKFLSVVPESRRDRAKLTLMRLFPRFENVGYSYGFLERWDTLRLVCSKKHFDTYFRMGIGDETLSTTEIDELIAQAGDVEYIKRAFRNASAAIKKNGKSKVPLLFDELNLHAGRVENAKLPMLISAIFEIADDIYREGDRERGFSIGDTHLRIHWLIRKLTFDRCNVAERSSIFMSACKKAQVGWLTDFVTSAIADYFPREGKEPEPPEKCLLAREDIPAAKAQALSTIRIAAETGELIFNPRLPFVLLKWKEFSEENSAEVRAWTSNQLNSVESIALLAKAFTSESWSQGMGVGGLGDRVAVRSFRVSVKGLEELLNIGEFRRRLEELESGEDIEEKLKNDISVFLDAWRRQEKGGSEEA